MHEADPSLLRFFEYIGPWIGNAAGLISALVAWIVHRLQKQVDAGEQEMKDLRKELPETYSRRDDVSERFDRLEKHLEKTSEETNRKLDLLLASQLRAGQG